MTPNEDRPKNLQVPIVIAYVQLVCVGVFLMSFFGSRNVEGAGFGIALEFMALAFPSAVAFVACFHYFINQRNDTLLHKMIAGTAMLSAALYALVWYMAIRYATSH